LGDPLKGNLLLFYKPLHLEAQQVSTRIEVRRHQAPCQDGDLEEIFITIIIDVSPSTIHDSHIHV
jgi:hypothetical protein